MTVPVVAVDQWAAQVRAGEVRAVSPAITAIENHAPEAEELLRLGFPHTGNAHSTGVTGGRRRAKGTLAGRRGALHPKPEEQAGAAAVSRTPPESGGGRRGRPS